MTALVELAALLHRETGIRLAENQHPALLAALDRAAPSGDPSSFLHQLADPVTGRDALAQLIDEVTVKETFFLRDSGQLDEITWHLVLEQARAAGDDTIRVWCAGCATGEEAYSLALLATEAFAPDVAPVSILGTDISRQALAAAREGAYRPRSVRELSARVRRRYFREVGDRLMVGEQLRSHVTFALHNLACDPLPPLGVSPFHLVLCRNVLIYFDAETVEQVIDGLERSLAPAGRLILGAADALCGSAGRLRAIAPLVVPTVQPSRPRRRTEQPRPKPRRSRATPVAQEPPDEIAYFVRGLEALESGDAAAAVELFRSALYLDPDFGLAAFKLGRAHEALANSAAARRAYEQSLRTLDHVAERHEELFEQVDPADVAIAARIRLEALASIGVSARRLSPRS